MSKLLSSHLLTPSEEIKNFFNKIRIHGHLVSGYRQVIKAMEQGKAKMVFLSADCDEAGYKALANAICKKNNLVACTKFKRAELGELAGQYKMKGPVSEARMGKVHKASLVAIIDFGSLTSEDIQSFTALCQ